MSNTLDNGYRKVKRQIAEKIHEITDLWQCGVTNRIAAFDCGIKKWNDPDMDVDVLGMTGEYKRDILSKILKVNRPEYKEKIYPPKIENNEGDWQNPNKLKFFLDFETIGNIFFDANEEKESHSDSKEREEKDYNLHESKGDSKDEKKETKKKYNDNNRDENNDGDSNGDDASGDIIFLIGFGYEYKGEWKAEQLVLEDLSIEGERKLLRNFITRIREISLECSEENEMKDNDEDDIPIYHWGSFEKTMFNKAINKLGIKLGSLKNSIEFIDMNRIFKKEPIIPKTALNFSFKNIGNAFYNLGLIDATWNRNSKILSGEDAMYYAWKYYSSDLNSGEKYKSIMNDIKEYNKKDFEILYKVVKVLRDYT